MMTILAILSGLLIGLSLGALGGGGSILTVPAMVYLLGMTAHQATGASLIVVGIAAVVGAITHARAGRVALKDGTLFGILGIAGAYVGSRLSAAVPSSVLLAGFGMLMLVAAVAMIIRQRSQRTGPADPEPGPAVTGGTDSLPNGGPPASLSSPASPAAGVSGPSGPATPAGAVATLATDAPEAGRAHPGRGTGLRHAALVAAAATVVGLVTGFFGVGGGFLIVPVLILVLRFDMATAAGTSLLVIAIDSVASLLTRMGHGALSLNWAVIGIFTGAAVLGAVFGGRVAGRVDQRRLAVSFIALIVVLAIYTLARSVPGLV